MNIILNAYLFAKDAHAGQVRKYSGDPYITHPQRVAEKLHSFGFTDSTVAVGFLHDVLEDTQWTHEQLRMFFPKYVVDLVVELTNTSKQTGLPRANRKLLDRTRIASISPVAKAIKCIDRADNLLSIPIEATFIHLYLEESELLLDSLKDLRLYSGQFNGTLSKSLEYLVNTIGEIRQKCKISEV